MKYIKLFEKFEDQKLFTQIHVANEVNDIEPLNLVLLNNQNISKDDALDIYNFTKSIGCKIQNFIIRSSNNNPIPKGGLYPYEYHILNRMKSDNGYVEFFCQKGRRAFKFEIVDIGDGLFLVRCHPYQGITYPRSFECKGLQGVEQLIKHLFTLGYTKDFYQGKYV